jgi:SAM-dependent methyltransferase
MNNVKDASDILDDYIDTNSQELLGHLRPLHSNGSPTPLELELKDEERIRDYLLSLNSFADAPMEGRNYINHALRRFIITVNMVPPAAHPQQRLLEIGAGPYYTTLLLQRLRGYDMYLTNFYGDNHPALGQQIIRSSRDNVAYECNYVSVNVERDPLPYPDETFDVVLFCEVIEHLTQDPTFALAELHRVLKPGGYLLVTTPNVFRLQHLLYIMGGRHNLFHPYSGHGVYGRHQREYGLGELIDLVQGCGFAIVRAEIADFEPFINWVERSVKRLWRHRRDNLFLLAQRQLVRRYYYPPSLYIATQGIQHVVDSDIRMGINDIGHLGWGWWGIDSMPDGSVRWTTAAAQVNLALPKAAGKQIVVEANGMGKMLGHLTVTLATGDQKQEFHLTDDEWHSLAVPLPIASAGQIATCEIRAEPIRSPKDLAVNADDRQLGVMIRRLYIR